VSAPNLRTNAKLCACVAALLALCMNARAQGGAKPALPQGSEAVDSVLTKAGQLSIVRVGDPTDMKFELRLKGRKVFDITEVMEASFVAQFRTYNSGELVVMYTSEGGSACPAQFRVVRVEDGGRVSVTDEFGDCGDSPTITLQRLPEDELTFRFQGYYQLNQEQEPGFKKPPPSTWVYKKGVLRQLNAAPARRGK
jgi:hypothetical protein